MCYCQGLENTTSFLVQDGEEERLGAQDVVDGLLRGESQVRGHEEEKEVRVVSKWFKYKKTTFFLGYEEEEEGKLLPRMW